MAKDDKFAAGAGAALGFLAIKPVLTVAGAASGLSAPGITSALAAIEIGGMVDGIVTTAAFPLIGADIGYGCWKGDKCWKRRKDDE